MSTKIPWADETWNPVTGCTPISRGCANCYAAKMFERHLWDYDFTPGTVHPNRMAQPSKWKSHKKVFVCSMGDLFHKDVAGSDIADVWQVMEDNPQHTFMVLTKRPERMRQILCEPCNISIPSHIWLGVTAENRHQASWRIGVLVSIPAKVRFVSVEPMLEGISLAGSYRGDGPRSHGVDWVIAGPETGTRARYCSPKWIDNLHTECICSDIPFFDKRDDYIAREWPEEAK